VKALGLRHAQVENITKDGDNSNCKVGMPESNIEIIWIPIFEWHVVRCESKNSHQKNMCLKEIRLHAQNMLIILGSIINMIGRTSVAT